MLKQFFVYLNEIAPHALLKQCDSKEEAMEYMRNFVPVSAYHFLVAGWKVIVCEVVPKVIGAYSGRLMIEQDPDLDETTEVL